LISTLLLPFFGGSQFGDQVKSLLLALEHHILDGSSSDESLQEDQGSVSLILLILRLIPNIVITFVVHKLILRRCRSNLYLGDRSLLLLLVIFLLLKLDLCLN
jgi:hypothetical protein